MRARENGSGRATRSAGEPSTRRKSGRTAPAQLDDRRSATRKLVQLRALANPEGSRVLDVTARDVSGSSVVTGRVKKLPRKANPTKQLARTPPVVQPSWGDWALTLAKAGLAAGAGAAVASVAGVALGTGALVGAGIYGAKKLYDATGTASYKFGDNVKGSYTGWDEGQRTNVAHASREGIMVNARHNRGSAYVTRPGYEDTYTGMLKGVKGGQPDQQVASDLLHGSGKAITDEKQKVYAALLEATVGVAEEWRKRGASWIFRGILRGIEGGKWTLSQIPVLFRFVKSAKDGRVQVGLFQDVKEGRQPRSALSSEQQDVFDYCSDTDESGYESDPDVRGAHGMKGKRLFSAKHK